MASPTDHNAEAALSLERLLPRIRARAGVAGGSDVPARWTAFAERLERHWPYLFGPLLELYGSRYDFFYHLEELAWSLFESWMERPADLVELDERRERDGDWLASPSMVGGALYVDLFSENLPKLREHIPYFKRIGITYLHLMPLFAVRPGDSDGGYAISNYRSVNPSLGDLDDLTELARRLRSEGISLVLDFVFNHTSDEHEWARRAQAGDPVHREYYFTFPDRTLPDRYELTLREIFPTVRRGSFTWYPEMDRWVWTTFNSFQWDLNYANPEVFRAMAGEMLFLANAGVEVLRLDAVAFLWKRMGTSCENLPEAHLVIRAFNALARIAAPALTFMSEAIVAPDEVVRYVHPRECPVSYNPLLMALLWEALATRDVRFLAYSMRKRFRIEDGCTWANYLRCHDDIGWTFDDDDAAAVEIRAYDHRRFLNQFYTGQFEGSFARGVPFQHNPDTNDMRISGTLASLAGLEQALERADPELVEMAVRRILLLRGVIMSIGGFPLIYLGEEWGLLNDYDYVADPAKEGDSRWVHRPRIRWEYLESLDAPDSVSRRIYAELVRLVGLRRETPAFSGSRTAFEETGNESLFAYTRGASGQHVLVVANFSEATQQMEANRLRLAARSTRMRDLLTGEAHTTREALTLGPYEFVWLEADVAGGRLG
ncbi:MAG: alpha-glucosidase C-terminal domain-containing protein [Gemmatimonadetes bacterium]|nr:alpha-glucosidase C-terminal domain-containing protein [Gemmatimonadota bacterium]